MPRGQVSIEMLTAIIVLLFVLLVLLVQLSYQQQQTESLRTSLLQKNECTKLQSAITLVNSSSGNSSLETIISFDANIEKNTISFSSYYCYFPGSEINSQIAPGMVLVKKEGGAISVQNE